MTTRRKHGEMRDDVIRLLMNYGAHTATQIMSACSLHYEKTQELLAELIEQGHLTVFWDNTTSGKMCRHYAINGWSESLFNKNCEEKK